MRTNIHQMTYTTVPNSTLPDSHKLQAIQLCIISLKLNGKIVAYPQQKNYTAIKRNKLPLWEAAGMNLTNTVLSRGSQRPTRREYSFASSRLHEACPLALREIWKFAMKEMCADTTLSKAVWAKGIKDIPYSILVRLSRKHNEDEDLPNKLYTLVTCVPVTTFKNLQTINVHENWLKLLNCKQLIKLHEQNLNMI